MVVRDAINETNAARVILRAHRPFLEHFTQNTNFRILASNTYANI